MIKKWYIDLIKNKKRILVAIHRGIANAIWNYYQRFDFAQRLWPDPSTTLRILLK
jgi:hypothetical protein